MLTYMLLKIKEKKSIISSFSWLLNSKKLRMINILTATFLHFSMNTEKKFTHIKEKKN